MRALILMLVGCLAASCAASDDEETTPGLSVNESGSTVFVNDDWTACDAVIDCVEVGSSCDGCCGRVAISASLQEDYEAAKLNLCEDYEGGVCDCAPLPTTLECVNNTCVLTPT